MIISLKYTPNPNSVQFFVDIQWLDIFWECKDSFTANKSPLTKEIWDLGMITYLLVGKDFIVINKMQTENWDELIPVITNIITSFLSKETHIFRLSDETYKNILESATSNRERQEQSSTDFEQKIVAVLDEKIRPGLELHGGGVNFFYFKDGVLALQFTGACAGCPSSMETLEFGIKQIMQYYFPEIEKIEMM